MTGRTRRLPSKRAAPLVLLLGLVAAEARAHGHPRAEPTASVAGKTVTIAYSRPSLQGRNLAALLPPDHLWRMGADVPTMLKTDADLRFGEASVPRGTYILLGKKLASGDWRLVIGVPKTKWAWEWPWPHRVSDLSILAEVPLVQTSVPESVELLTIELRGEMDRGEFQLTWGTTALKASFTGR